MNMMSAPRESLPAPQVYGNELETSIQFVCQKDEQGDDILVDSQTLYTFDYADYVSTLVPQELATGFEYIKNGFRMYDGRCNRNGDERLEIATAECATVEEAVISTRVSERLLENGIVQYIALLRMNGGLENVKKIRTQKRVIDIEGNVWGCHDNFGFDEKTFDAITVKLDYLVEYLKTRSLIVGAGYVNNNRQYRFAQKIDGLTKLAGHGYYGRYFRTAHNTSEEIKRIEIGSSDANISDWATRARIGSAAILFAVLATDSEKPLRRYGTGEIHVDKILLAGKYLNNAAVKNGSLDLSKDQWLGVEFQQRLMEIYMDKAAKEVDDNQLLRIAQEIHEFCDDMKKVGLGREPFKILADRADWAAKLTAIQKRIRDAGNLGIHRTFGDYETQATDLEYDYTGYIPKDDRGCFIEQGIGYQIRDRGFFRYTVPEHQIKRMYTTPPRTRAAARCSLLNSGATISSVNWHHVTTHADNVYKEYCLRDASSDQLPVYDVMRY